MRPALGVLADVCCVLAFVIIGRGQHHDGVTVAGVASTAWPFLAGLAAGILAGRACGSRSHYGRPGSWCGPPRW